MDGCNFQLGEYPLSWGYGGTAKFSTDSKFSDFNVKFYKGDVVTAYLVSQSLRRSYNPPPPKSQYTVLC